MVLLNLFLINSIINFPNVSSIVIVDREHCAIYLDRLLLLDLYMYFDAGDFESPINQFATTLSPYPQDAFGKFPVDGIRGNVILGKYSANFTVSLFYRDFLFQGIHVF